MAANSISTNEHAKFQPIDFNNIQKLNSHANLNKHMNPVASNSHQFYNNNKMNERQTNYSDLINDMNFNLTLNSQNTNNFNMNKLQSNVNGFIGDKCEANGLARTKSSKFEPLTGKVFNPQENCSQLFNETGLIQNVRLINPLDHYEADNDDFISQQRLIANQTRNSNNNLMMDISAPSSLASNGNNMSAFAKYPKQTHLIGK